MSRTFLLCLMIFVINEVTCFEESDQYLYDAADLHNHLSLFYKFAQRYRTNDTTAAVNPTSKLDRMMKIDLKSLSKDLKRFEHHESAFFGNVAHTTLYINGITDEFNNMKLLLNDYVSDVEYWFIKSMESKLNERFSKKTHNFFTRMVLDIEDNLNRKLFKIFEIVIGNNKQSKTGLLSLAIKNSQEHYGQFCDNYFSQQQHIYTLFIIYIRAQLRGFAAISHAFLTKYNLNNGVGHTKKYKIFRKSFHRQLRLAINSFIIASDNLSTEIRRCDIKKPVIGENVIELEKLYQVIVNYESYMKDVIRPLANHTVEKSENKDDSYPMKFHFHSCKTYVSLMGCPVFKSHHLEEIGRFKFFRTPGEQFGRRQDCDNLYKLRAMPKDTGAENDNICVCSVDFTDSQYFPYDSNIVIVDEPKIIKISVLPQLSDVANNMIVVGVRFILHNNIIHLQIKQSKILNNGFTLSKGEWKPVDVDNNNHGTIEILYSTFNNIRNILHLDDVMVPPGDVVTGVRLQLTNEANGFELNVQSTKYNGNKGELINVQEWHEPGDYAINPLDYARERVEIKLDDPDNPIMEKNYDSDPSSNKFIQFQHTSIKKDAGYHTVPFLDAQSVEVLPEFPLGGIGLFHRGRNGFGGYIAPRIHTYNITPVLEFSFEKYDRTTPSIKCPSVVKSQ